MTGTCRAINPMRAVLMVILGGLAAAGGGEAARAQEDKAPSYDVTVWAIRATKSNSEVSSELKPIARELKKQFSFTGFKLERKQTGRTKQGSAIAVDLVAGFKAKVTPTAQQDKRVTLKIEVTRREGNSDKRLVSTTVTITRAQFQLLGGWKLESKSDDVLIVAVSAR